ncbi:toll-like receptor 3 isoform X2 [Nilaparvata lugens]|uniref:toll-like receptor 3 isoform X2 n=1 Tax=Nilaparvata lugens TaxID=108931 RepID=UPI00193D7857|nr:toll-like receptor 3 isoform X2 [Nilaparvata lugens]
MKFPILILVLLLGCDGGYIPPGPKYPCPPTSQLLYPCECTKGTDQGLFISCENTNLASLSVAMSNIVALQSPIEELKIMKSQIGRLYGELFYPLSMRKLSIEDTPISSVAPHIFYGVNKTMKELHIINSEIAEFPTVPFQDLGNLSVLIIEGHKMKRIPTEAFGSGLLATHLEELRLTKGELSEIPLAALAPCKKLKKLDLQGNHLFTLQKNQFKGLRDVELLDLSFNNLTKLDGSFFGELSKLGWCNLSHNALTDLPRGVFARNSVLKSLNLAYNKLTKLDSNSFRGMRFIRRLYLSDNLISNVGRGTFGTMARIGTIDLARNKLKKIDFQMFHELRYIEVIDVSENMVDEIEGFAFKDLYLVHMNLSHNKITKIKKDAFVNCANITVLDLSYNKLEDIQSKAFDEISYATELQLSFNLLTDLLQVPLANMTGLKILNVTNNRLTKIPKNTFPKLYELHTIDVSRNFIKDIAVGVFQTLFGLRWLDLSYNSLNEIQSGTFGTLPTLLYMNLEHNHLEKISNAAFNRLTSLRTLNLMNNSISKIFEIPISLAKLDLSENSIEEMPPSTWPSMNSLLELNLSNNILGDSLESGSFSHLLTLTKLDLSLNGISLPPWQSLSSLTSLQWLSVKNNELEELGKSAFGTLPIVLNLDLSYNKIANVSVMAFNGLLQLLHLNMSHNQLHHLHNGVFQGLVSLQLLDLSHNMLESLDNKTHSVFEDCLSLETLNMSHNRVSFVTRKTFPSNPWVPYKLKVIDLSHNNIPVLSFDFTYGTKKVVSLDVSHNMIDEVRRYVVGNLTSLQKLDLSNNEITELPTDVFNLQANLTSLSLANNHLHALPVDKFKHLTYIDVSNNEIEMVYNEILDSAKKGSKVFYGGNPMLCNCYLRPLKRWLKSKITPDETWKNVTCSFPEALANRTILDLTEEELSCVEEVTDSDFQLTPDIMFRSSIRTHRDFQISWFVNTKEDISDFKILVRDSATKITLQEKTLSYESRSTVLKHLPESQDLEVCVQTLSSLGVARPLKPGQCVTVHESATSGIASIHWSYLSLVVLSSISTSEVIF